MIAVDTSALIAVLAREPLGPACESALLENELVISAGTLTEALIVASSMDLLPAMTALLDSLEPEIVDVTAAFAERASAGYRRWGKGFHPARLNYGDSFSYALARMYDCPLLYVGDDFAKTDVVSALG
ncbi:type II toxin-antitoxin system VapC family toxin [Brevundimonas sp.]|uniref:type II toxin-antitoxin system VapC family toxin n=1 Tax=Brevundimonas sp. TaxID=1871086 RepID=UPI002FDA2E01